MRRLIFLALLVAAPLLAAGAQPASACWGWRGSGYGYSSYRPAYRYAYRPAYAYAGWGWRGRGWGWRGRGWGWRGRRW